MEILTGKQPLASFFIKPFISISIDSSTCFVEVVTERLVIRSCIEEDFNNCVLLYGDEKIVGYFDSGKTRCSSEVFALLKERAFKYFRNGKPFGLFSVFLRESETFIGQIDLLPTLDIGVMEIGFIFLQEYQNKGFCSEAAKAMIFEYVEELNFRKYSCKELPIYKIIATVHPENKPSIKVLEKIGMTLNKRRDRFGQPRLWYSVLTSEGSQLSKKRG